MSVKQSHFDDKKYTYDYFCQGNVCRLCWSSTDRLKSIKKYSKIAENILENIGIDITTDTPNTVCGVCLKKIISFVNFKKKCQEAEKKLKIILFRTFEEHYDNPTILKKEADLELQLLEEEVKKEKLEILIIKDEKKSNLEIDDPGSDYDDLLPKDDNYCYICSLNFESTEQMIQHNIESHKTKKVLYQCGRCKEEFETFALKTNHETQFCKALNEFTCNICNKTLPTYDSFGSHMREHESEQKRDLMPFQCLKCPEAFESGASLGRHMVTHYKEKKRKNSNEKTVCEVCGQVYAKNNIHMHMLIHTQNKKLKCPHCEYRATLPASLKTHIKLHTGEKPFACDVCPYRCITSSNLNKHRKTHTGVKEYTCHICNKGYRYNMSLKDHITAAHQGERKYRCKKCGATYFHFKGLRKHMLVKHGQRVKKIKDDFVEVDGDSYTRAKIDKDRRMGLEKCGLNPEVDMVPDETMVQNEAEIGPDGGMDLEDDEVVVEAELNQYKNFHDKIF